LILDWIMGPTLYQHVTAHGPIAVEDADGLAAGLLGALESTHQHGLVHRDVCPCNIILHQTAQEVTPKLLDFTQAKHFGVSAADGRAPQAQVIGTPWFMAPEQAVDAELVDLRADVFGAAATLYYALTGKAPFSGDAKTALAAARACSFVPLAELRPEIPARIGKALSAAMTKDPAQRLPDTRALLQAWSDGAAEPPRFRLPLGPTGDVTLVFTDVQGSTSMWEVEPATMRLVLAAHDAVMRSSLLRLGGYEVKTQGDSFMVAFSDAVAAVRWCVEVQVALDRHPWPLALASPSARGRAKVLVRMGVHLGEPECKPHPISGAMDYFGPMVNCTARISGAAHGGQILASAEIVRRVGPQLRGASTRALGMFRLKGIASPIELWEVVPAELAREFPPPNAQPGTS
jgi:class 3 adenylate cyclase